MQCETNAGFVPGKKNDTCRAAMEKLCGTYMSLCNESFSRKDGITGRAVKRLSKKCR